MTDYPNGRLSDDPAVKRLKAARRVSMIIGLALAAAAVGAMSAALIWQPKPAGQQAASKKALTHEAMTLRRIATFAVNSVPDSVQIDPHGKIVVVVTGDSQVSAWSISNLRQ